MTVPVIIGLQLGVRVTVVPYAIEVVEAVVGAVVFSGLNYVIGCVSMIFTDPATASGFLGDYGILGIVIM